MIEDIFFAALFAFICMILDIIFDKQIKNLYYKYIKCGYTVINRCELKKLKDDSEILQDLFKKFEECEKKQIK